MQVSVLMPVYNGMPYLPAAVDSILAQTFGDFEFIVVDDGSTDATPDALARYCDPRLVIVRTDHRGLIPALQTAAETARAPVLARMDADDLSFPERLAAQLRLLNERDDLAVVGCVANFIDRDGREVGTFRPPLAGDAMLDLAAGNPLVHGSVMMRRRDFDAAGGYRHAPEDYALWIRLAELGKGLGFVDSVLYAFREHPERYSLTHLKSQSRGILNVQLPLLRHCTDSRDSRDPATCERLLRGWGRIGAAAIACKESAITDEALSCVLRLHRAAREGGKKLSPSVMAAFDDAAEHLVWAGCDFPTALRLRLAQWRTRPLEPARWRDLALCFPPVKAVQRLRKRRGTPSNLL